MAEKVEYYTGSTLIGQSSTTPNFPFTWVGVAAGNHALTSKYYRDSVLKDTSSVVNISVEGGTAGATTSGIISPYEGEVLNDQQDVIFKFDTKITQSTPFVADVASYAGANDTEKMLAAIEDVNTHGGGEVIFQGRNFFFSRHIPVCSNITYRIISCTVELDNKVFDNVFRSEGLIPNPNAPWEKCIYEYETRNFKILGDGTATAFFKGASVKGLDPADGTTPLEGDQYGWRTIGALFVNCKNYEMGNLSYRQASGWSISNEFGCDNGHFHDLDLFTNCENGDGVNLRSGCSNMIIEDIVADTDDDNVALTTLVFKDTLWQTPYPPQAMGFEYKPPSECHISGVTIRNITGHTEASNLRLLANGGAQIFDINASAISDVAGGRHGLNGIIISTGFGVIRYQPNDIRNVTLSNITVVDANNSIYCSVIVDNVNGDVIKHGSTVAAPTMPAESTNSGYTNVTVI